MIVTLPNLHLPTLTHMETYEVPVSIYLYDFALVSLSLSLSLTSYSLLFLSFFLYTMSSSVHTNLTYIYTRRRTDGRIDWREGFYQGSLNYLRHV